jgi:16S rRNA (guanine527-N7)-methyltransferase
MEQILKYCPELTARQREQFAALGSLYAGWNARINVISRRETASPGEFYTRHVLHSLAIAKVHSFGAGTRVLDIGTGGGFPAVPLAIMFPEARFTAVDSIGKKIRVVEEVARAVGLENLTPVNARAESIAGRFDFTVSRAVAPAATLLEWTKAKTERGFLFLKGGDLDAELAETRRPYTEYRIAEWFDEEFFATKKVIFIEL